MVIRKMFLILTNSCLVVILLYDMFLSQDLVYWQTAFEQKRAGRRYLMLKHIKNFVRLFYISAQPVTKQCSNAFTKFE